MALKDVSFELVSLLASYFHASLLKVSIESISMLLLSIVLVCVFLVRRFFPMGVNLLIVLFSVFVANTIPTLLPSTPFDPQLYTPNNYMFDTRTEFPSFTPMLLKNSTLTTSGPWFTDSEERVLLLRGVNLAGATKLPSTPDGSTWKNVSKGFWYDRGDVSFVDRPFPLSEADEHFGRLRSWGLTFIRLLITWEAVEHAGPGQYDQDYLQYLLALVKKADEYGISVFIDPHQDVWSRWSGGDGAPYWTLEAVGFNLDTLDKTGAAITHQSHGDPLPAMIWGSNNFRLCTATMFTLFFGGNTFAPSIKAAHTGESIQDFLQNHYIAAMVEVAKVLRNERNVVGFDTLNEPNNGWIGRKDLASRSDGMGFRWGLDLSPFEQMVASSGFGSVSAEMYNPPFVHMRHEVINPDNLSAWTDPEGCVWRRSGVWDVVDGVPTLLRPNHFELKEGQSFINEFMVPMWKRMKRELSLQQAQPLLMFAEPPIDFNDPAKHDIPNLGEEQSDWVYAPHWYEIVGLISKSYCSWLGIAQWQWPIWEQITGGPILGPVIGRENLVAGYSATFGELAHVGAAMGGPTVIGETGIAMDMVKKEAFSSGDWSSQVNALDNVMAAMDNNLLSFTLWNYSPQNDNLHGDQWNDEDLSLFSRSQVNKNDHALDPYSGGRALAAAVRPYARKVSGTPMKMSFNLYERIFSLDVASTRPQHPTEVFVPLLHYPTGIQVSVSSGHWDFLADKQVLLWWHGETSEPLHTLTITDPRSKQ